MEPPPRRGARACESRALPYVLAVTQGVFDEPTTAAIEKNAADVEALVANWGLPFSDGWESFRPDPASPIPSLTP